MKTKMILLLIILSPCFLVFGQSYDVKTDSITTTAKSKKQFYIENYIANFPYKNSEIYQIIKQKNLWDTTGTVPVIDPIIISFNEKPSLKTMEKPVFEKEPK